MSLRNTFLISLIISHATKIKSETTIIETATDPSIENVTLPYASNGTDVNPPWLIEALKDIAYYLRAHKFNEYDRRYETNSESAPRDYYKLFPKPPLRSIHWEVHKMCDKSFLDCIQYIKEKIEQTAAQRMDDTIFVMAQQNWTMEKNKEQIEDIDRQCRIQKKRDSLRADPFEGPLERYQWRVSASYYMCWFTMKEVEVLQHLSESCDNFAECLDPNLGVSNRDLRADDSRSYGCALYSFCPDPCCPMTHLTRLENCWNAADNPCFEANPPGQRECVLKHSQNTDFRDIILNRWNVTCKCPEEGYEWNSLYGMCIDVDECAMALDDCDPKLEACVNLPGSFRCVCKWGHTWNSELRRCEASPALATIKLLSRHKGVENVEEKPLSIVGSIKMFFYDLFHGKKKT